MLFVMIGYFAFGKQNRGNTAKDSVEVVLKKIIKLLDASDNLEVPTRLFFSNKNFIDNSDDSWIQGASSMINSQMAMHSWDTKLCIENAKEAIVHFTKINAVLELGRCYELLGIANEINGNTKSGIENYSKAKEYFERATKKEYLIDINYNLANLYLSHMIMDSVAKYTRESIACIKVTNVKKGRLANLNRFLGETFRSKQQYDSAIFYCKKAIELSNDQYLVKAHSYSSLAKVFEEVGKQRLAKENYNNAFQDMDKYLNAIGERLKSSNIIKNEYQLEKEKNKRFIVENKFNAEKLKLRNYFIVLSGIIILGLIVIIILLKRSSKYREIVNIELVKARNIAEEASKLKSDFIERITHELRTPLNTITTVAYLLGKENLKAEKEKHIDVLKFSSKYLLHFINDVIDLNLLKNKKEVMLNAKQFNLRKTLEGIVNSIEVAKTKNKIDLVIADDLPEYVKGDELKIAQVLINLLTNANKFTYSGAIVIRVDLQAKTKDSVTINFLVEDTGIGIEKEKLASIFDDFYQGSVAINREYGGTGLGLSIAKEVLGLYGSTIVVESKLGVGTKLAFSLTLEADEVKDEVVFDYALKSNFKLLLVEDNRINQLLTKKILLNEGFRCDVANNGEEAVKLVGDNNYDLILMDIMMPVLDGYEATRQIRNFNTKVPILALTALSEKENKHRFEEVGISTILNKPIDPKSMFKSIFKEIAA